MIWLLWITLGHLLWMIQSWILIPTIRPRRPRQQQQQPPFHTIGYVGGLTTTTTTTTTSMTNEFQDQEIQQLPQQQTKQQQQKHPNVLIHWKGEDTEGYSLQLRHLEFPGALSAVIQSKVLQQQQSQQRQQQQSQPLEQPWQLDLRYWNALDCTNDNNDYDNNDENVNENGYNNNINNNNNKMPDSKQDRFNQALQYVQVTTTIRMDDDTTTTTTTSTTTTTTTTTPTVTLEDFKQAAQRCSLIHAIYLPLAEADTFVQLGIQALQSQALADLQVGQVHQHDTWCLRVRDYGGSDSSSSSGRDDDDHHHHPNNHNNINNNNKRTKKQKGKRRHGPRQTRSLSLEQVALQDLKPLLITFGGTVDLSRPDCKLYIFNGIASFTMTTTNNNRNNNRNTTKVLTRLLTKGARHLSTIAPTTRLCVTTTPLCPIAAYCLCNAAQIQPYHTILDPYGGSGTILLAATMIEPTIQCISIDIAHNGHVNRTNIVYDFISRQLFPSLLALISGDSTKTNIRQVAKTILIKSQQQQIQTKQQKEEKEKDHNHQYDENDEKEDLLGVFDCIITDPPYGIREAASYDTMDKQNNNNTDNNKKKTTPIQELLSSIEYDRDVVGHRLLRKGGKLVCFLPSCSSTTTTTDIEGDDGNNNKKEEEQDDDTKNKNNKNNNNKSMIMGPIQNVLPTVDEMERAGLRLMTMHEQYLNDNLSRWLVVFDCIR